MVHSDSDHSSLLVTLIRYKLALGALLFLDYGFRETGEQSGSIESNTHKSAAKSHK